MMHIARSALPSVTDTARAISRLRREVGSFSSFRPAKGKHGLRDERMRIRQFGLNDDLVLLFFLELSLLPYRTRRCTIGVGEGLAIDDDLA